MVGYYSYTVPAYSDAIAQGENFIYYLDSIISSSFVEDKTIITTRPDWANGGETYEEIFILGITFKYHGTEFVVSTSKSSSSTSVHIYIYARNNRISLSWGRTNYILNNSTSDKILNYLIGQNSDYFVFSHYNESSYYQYIVIKVDSPVNLADTDLYVSILNSSQGTYNKSFDGEDINTTPVRFALSTQINYSSGFLTNYYNKKTELYNVYVYTGVYGIRGKISNLICLPKTRSTSLGTFYTVNGVEYVGLNGLADIVYGFYGMLLKSY